MKIILNFSAQKIKSNVVRKDDDNVLKRALILQVNGQRKREEPKQTWRR